MASNINPNNIDTTYPIAGQDNDSQGFRDNFTNIKTNFEYAESEIDDLQAKAVLKSALTGTTLDNDMAGSLIQNAKFQADRYTKVALGSVSGSTTIDFSAGNYQNLTTNGDVTLVFSNLPAAGNTAFWRILVTVSQTTHTLTFPAAVGAGTSAASVDGIQGWSSNVITFNETGTYEFELRTDDGGSSVYLSELTRPRARYINPIRLAVHEDLASGEAADLTKSVSYFATDAGETATLADGSTGQIKVFAMTGDSGNMVITVASPGWGGSGTITFDTVGDACTLMFIQGKWYCIGNNGAAFA